ncbi:hypothetical protein Nhal_0961 [Nitrosococcus halophilus Nc 4]|uniref:Uncharacterized protein n=1 Tax=Nitrosococcus halophilus (strain Nc4) TaxID=472759 RepID=D5BYF1_NITHN|nr:hypothetical protein [Nitrosococcus halophilus]ADE14134.1 hypothetical protein Nhal_0961 [Nitrosococcus halophilus Nc 4]
MSIKKKVPAAIRKMEATIKALDDLENELDKREIDAPGIIQLKRDLTEFCEYLENAQWWRKA